MGFSAPLGRAFRPPFGPALASAAAASWWLSGGIAALNAIAVYQSKGAASLAASYTNLANPGTYTAAPGIAPTWGATTGWTSTGSQYLTTGITPNTNQVYSAIARFIEGDGVSRSLFGILNTAGSVALDVEPATGSRTYFHWGQIAFASGAGSAGTLGVAGNQGFLNGVAEAGTMAGFSGSLPAGGIYILGRNFNDALNNGYNGSVLAVAFYDTVLSAPQMLAVHTAMMAL